MLTLRSPDADRVLFHMSNYIPRRRRCPYRGAYPAAEAAVPRKQFRIFSGLNRRSGFSPPLPVISRRFSGASAAPEPPRQWRCPCTPIRNRDGADTRTGRRESGYFLIIPRSPLPDKKFLREDGGKGGRRGLFTKSPLLPPASFLRYLTLTRLYSLVPRPIFSAWARVSFQRMLGLESMKWSL